MGQDAVSATSCEKQGNNGKYSGQERRRSPFNQTVVDPRLHRVKVGYWKLGINLTHKRAKRRFERFRLQCGTDDYIVGVVRVVCIREIDGALRNRPAQAWLEGTSIKITPLS